MNKLSPRPWKIGSPLGIKNPAGEWVSEPVYSIFYNDASPPYGPSSFGCAKLADALLIAAAPDLLEACKLALSAPYSTYAQVLRDAIAKAEGQK